MAQSPSLPPTIRVHLALITVSVLFGGHFVFTKQILAQVPASSWVFFRIAAATAMLVPLALWLRRQPGIPNARRWVLLGIASFFGVVLNQIFFTEGLALTTPEHSAIVNSCIPTWTLIVATVVGQERLRRRKVVAILIALTGVLYLLGFDRILLDDGSGFGGDTLIGDLLSAANGLAFAIHLVMMRRISRDLDPWTTTAILFLQGTVMIGLWSAPGITAEHVETCFSPPILWFALYTVLGATVLAYLLNTWALRHTQSTNVALYINLQPLVAAALNSAMGAPAPGHRFFIALGLVALGLWLQTGPRRDRQVDLADGRVTCPPSNERTDN